MIQKQSLEVTKLKPGAFNHFMMEQHAAGADLAHLKPPHMNDRDEIELGWEPKYPDLRTIIEHAWQWHRTHPNGYRS